MKLSKCLQYINTALNFPAISYEDISLFFDMAIAELNTTLHTSIVPVSVMIDQFRQKMSKESGNKIILTENPEDNNLLIEVDPDSPTGDTIQVYYSTEDKLFYVYKKYTEDYAPYKIVIGIYIDENSKQHIYQTINYGNTASWAETAQGYSVECDLSDYLPDDWVLLWLIPYVCYKYTVRDGGTAQSFAEELTQGFQQLQETYNIPDKVILTTYAGKLAYSKLVEENLPNLNIYVPTQAIYESMKHPRNLNAIFGSFYDRGGF